MVSAQSIKGWLPGEHVSELTFVGVSQPEGERELSLGIVRSGGEVAEMLKRRAAAARNGRLPALSAEQESREYSATAVKLAIAGRDAEGWYPLSKIKVVAP
jgi:hypothetical protein